MVILVDANKGIHKIQPLLKHECFLKKYDIWLKLKTLYFYCKKIEKTI